MDNKDLRKLLYEDDPELITKYRGKTTISHSLIAPKDWTKESFYTIPINRYVELKRSRIINIGEHWLSMLTYIKKSAIGDMTSLLAMQFGMTQEVVNQDGATEEKYKYLFHNMHERYPEEHIKEHPEWKNIASHATNSSYLSYSYTGTATGMTQEERIKALSKEKAAETGPHKFPPIVEQIRKLNEGEQACFYTYLALCMMRGPFTQVNRLCKPTGPQVEAILRNFTNFYQIALPFSELEINLDSITHIASVNRNESRPMNTVLSAALMRRFDPSGEEYTGLLDFCLVQRASFTGMHAYSLFAKAVHLYKIKENAMLELMCLGFTESAIMSLVEVIHKYDNSEGESPNGKYAYWQWARAFSHLYFTSVQTKDNKEVGYLMACIVACKELKKEQDPRDIVPFQDISQVRKAEINNIAARIASLISKQTDDMADDNKFATAFREAKATSKLPPKIPSVVSINDI